MKQSRRDRYIYKIKSKYNVYSKRMQYLTRIPEKYLISYKSRTKDLWDKLILVLAIQNSFIIPIDFAFKPEFTKIPNFQIFDAIVDIIFVIDMVLMFLTTYIDNKG
jgi:hypothetical protein